jgi:hypothetical protein
MENNEFLDGMSRLGYGGLASDFIGMKACCDQHVREYVLAGCRSAMLRPMTIRAATR